MERARLAADGLSAREASGARAQAWESPEGWTVGYWSPGAIRVSATQTVIDEAAARRAIAGWAEDR